MNTQIQVGSRAFFNGYEDFEPHDNDIVEFIDDADADFWITDEDEMHIFHFKTMDKDDFIKFEMNRCKRFPLVATKFLVKELNEYLGINIYEIQDFAVYLNRIGSKHSYYKYIFQCYLENNSFDLTEELRLNAYEKYKENR